MKKITGFINRVDPRLIIVLILALHGAGFFLIDNEEQYFLYAKAFIDPSWIPNSFIANDVAGTRYLFQLIAGYFLNFFSFEQLAFWGRILNYLLLAFPLARLLKRFKINNLWFIFWFLLFYLPHQNLMGGEWIFGGFEAKTIAYVFILYSLDYSLRHKYLKAVLMATFAVYFHVLAGGWFLFYIFIFMFIEKVTFKNILKYAFISGIIILPFFIYLYTSLMVDNPIVINGINTNYLYTAVRNPNHTGILANIDYFLSHHLDGVILTIVALATGFLWFKKQKETLIRMSNLFMIIILIQNLLFVIVAYFDKNGYLMKYYPFRGSAIAMFLFQTIILYKLINSLPAISDFITRKKIVISPVKLQKYSNLLFFSLIAIIIFATAFTRYKDYNNNKSKYLAVKEAAQILKNNSKKGDMFMLFGNENSFTYTTMRNSQRDMFVCYRFIPTRSRDIYEWYKRLQLQAGVVNNIENLPSLLSEYPVNFIISGNELKSPYLSLIGKNREYIVYKIQKPKN